MTIDITNGMCKVIAVNIQKMSLEELTRLEKTVKRSIGSMTRLYKEVS